MRIAAAVQARATTYAIACIRKSSCWCERVERGWPMDRAGHAITATLCAYQHSR